jgi:hypothetical protein
MLGRMHLPPQICLDGQIFYKINVAKIILYAVRPSNQSMLLGLRPADKHPLGPVDRQGWALATHMPLKPNQQQRNQCRDCPVSSKQ